MRIIIDGMGGDNAPDEIVKGVVEASRVVNHDMFIVGDQTIIQNVLNKYDYDTNKVKIIHASEQITNDDAPVEAIKEKKDSSLVVALNALKKGEGDLFISAGNTGALVVGCLFILGRIKGIHRPALASVYPNLSTGDVSLLLDAGANADSRVKNLAQFALMGSIYSEYVFNKKNPRVGLVNIGSEEKKGSTVVKKTYQVLKASPLNFIGNVEARSLHDDVCDVIVCDGFVGNVILKLTEGVAWQLLKHIKRKITEGFKAKLGALLLKNKFLEMKKEFDYSEYGGAPILGVKGCVVKVHGSSGAAAVKNGIIKGTAFVENKVVEKIAEALPQMVITEDDEDNK